MPQSKKKNSENNEILKDFFAMLYELEEQYQYNDLYNKEQDKREEDDPLRQRISWDEMFMEIAKVVAKRSKDPHTKVGAVLVKDNHILSIGYNGEPKGFSYKFNWNTSEKYDYVIHAEMNVIANATYYGNSIEGSSIYLTLSPCHDCMKLLIQWGIKTVYYHDEYKDFEMTQKMAKSSNITLIKM